MTIPAISLHQPWASLCVTRQPCDCPDGPVQPRHDPAVTHPMVKRFETRSWPCPPNLIGQRIAIHATKRKPADGRVIGDYLIRRQGQGDIDYPHSDNYMRPIDRPARRYGSDAYLGDIIPLPLGAIVGSAAIEACFPIVSIDDETDYDPHDVITVDPYSDEMLFIDRPGVPPRQTDISDQLPYGTYEPGRYAWQLGDAAPVQERCPWCDRGVSPDFNCPACKGEMHCEPIPARGRQRIWN